MGKRKGPRSPEWHRVPFTCPASVAVRLRAVLQSMALVGKARFVWGPRRLTVWWSGTVPEILRELQAAGWTAHTYQFGVSVAQVRLLVGRLN